jgi:hypothetical protein
MTEITEKTQKRGHLQNLFTKLRKIPKLLVYQFKTSGLVKTFFGISLGLNLILWAGLIYLFRPQEEPVHLHYNIFFGVDLIGPWWQIFFLPASGLVILILNTGLSAASFKEDRALSYTVFVATIFFQLLLIIGSYLLTLMN